MLKDIDWKVDPECCFHHVHSTSKLNRSRELSKYCHAFPSLSKIFVCFIFISLSLFVFASILSYRNIIYRVISYFLIFLMLIIPGISFEKL